MSDETPVRVPLYMDRDEALGNEVGSDGRRALNTIIQNAPGQAIPVAGIVSGDFSPQGLRIKGLITMMTIDNTRWYEAPATPLANRNNIMIQNPSTSSADIIYNYDNTQPLADGVHIPPGIPVSIAIQGTIPVYITFAGPGALRLPVEELS